MITVHKNGGIYKNGTIVTTEPDLGPKASTGFRKTMAWKILSAHNHSGNDDKLEIRFDSMTSHDITYVGIVQTARASGMKEFPLPYVLTNCHNSLCAVGGTINEDDHIFGLSAAKKYGGDFVPAHLAVIHQYMREVMAGCGRMILGSDSHTRYGALGTMGVGEGGPELVKQLLGRFYQIDRPQVAAVYLKGTPRAGVGPQDVAIALIKAVFKDGLVKNRVMEFFGPGLAALSAEYRIGIDVMTTETTCLSSIWQTDERVKKYLTIHGRPEDYAMMKPEEGAWYDLVLEVNLDKIEPMIALPFHPSNAYTIREFLENADDLLAQVEAESAKYVGQQLFKPALRSKFRNGKFHTDQAIIAGCAGGGYENLYLAARLLRGRGAGNPAYNLSVYPASQPIFLELMRNGAATTLMESGAILRTAFCGPCFGAGDVPMNNGFSIRHTTRNFPNREGSQPGGGQMSYVALMDARSIAATTMNGGVLTAADKVECFPHELPGLEDGYSFDKSVYNKRVYYGWGKPTPSVDLVFGPNIADWPRMEALPENLYLKITSAIYDSVTTTDELIPSGEASSYRSNPLRLAEFTLSRKDPGYVGRAKEQKKREDERETLADGGDAKCCKTPSKELQAELDILRAHGFFPNEITGVEALRSLGLGSAVFALRPGDGSAREQAASCQKVLGGWANIALEYATKRYRSNLLNWGMVPFLFKDWESYKLEIGDRIYVPNIRQAISVGLADIPALLLREGKKEQISLQIGPLTVEEKQILLAGCLINYYAK